MTSSYGIHIIKCTDVFTAPEEVTSLDQIPAEWVESIKTALKSQKQSEAYQQWLEEYKESVDVVINPMPEGLSYAVDMSKYQAAAGSSDSGAGAAEGAADGSSEGEGDVADGSTEDGNAEAGAEGAGQPAENADASDTARTEQPAEAAN